MSATFTLIGREAIDFCERHRLQPWKHADSTDVEGRPVTGAEARAICRQDPAQVHVCLYDLEPQAAQLWAVSGPAWLRLDNLDPDEPPTGVMWVPEAAWVELVNRQVNSQEN